MQYAIPYMGSKRKLAQKIVDYILEMNPGTKYIYDLFGGGGAISFEFLQRKSIEKVVYNELNTGVCELLKDIMKNGVTDKYTQWIDCETFNAHKNDDDWFGGLCKCVWSFGNNQKNYLFGKDIEQLKKEAHFYLFEQGYTLGDKEKRIRLLKQFKRDVNIISRFNLQQLQQLQRLERLEQLEQLQQLQQLEILNLSYDEVNINTPIDKTVIYLDPPYKNTCEYAEVLDHNKLDEYIRKSPYKIYLSSYESGLIECESFVRRCTLSPTANNMVVEKLFSNKKDDRGKAYLF